MRERGEIEARPVGEVYRRIGPILIWQISLIVYIPCGLLLKKCKSFRNLSLNDYQKTGREMNISFDVRRKNLFMRKTLFTEQSRTIVVQYEQNYREKFLIAALASRKGSHGKQNKQWNRQGQFRKWLWKPSWKQTIRHY